MCIVAAASHAIRVTFSSVSSECNMFNGYESLIQSINLLHFHKTIADPSIILVSYIFLYLSFQRIYQK